MWFSEASHPNFDISRDSLLRVHIPPLPQACENESKSHIPQNIKTFNRSELMFTVRKKGRERERKTNASFFKAVSFHQKHEPRTGI